MALKPIISIGIEDQAFANLKRRYDQFDASVRKLPAEWRKLSAEMVGTQDLFKSMLGMSVAIAGAIKDAERAEVHRSHVTDHSVRQWKNLSREARDFSASVRGATLSIAKWAGLGSLLSGAGLFGLDRMAAGVAGARRFAMGIGTTIGGAAGFEANLERFVDPKEFLSKVGEMKMSIEGRSILGALGMTPKQINQDTAKLSIDLLRKAKEFADRTPEWGRSEYLKASLWDRLLGVQNIARLAGTQGGEFEEQVRKAAAAAPAMEPARPKEWQDFMTTLVNAGKMIETTFINGLTPIVEPLRKLAEAAPDLLGAFLKAPFLEKWIKDVADSLKEFGEYIGKDEFKKSVEAFVRGLGEMANAVGRVIMFFGGGSERPKEDTGGPEPILGRTSGEALGKIKGFGEAIVKPWMNFQNLPVLNASDRTGIDTDWINTDELERRHLQVKLKAAQARRILNMMTPGEPAIESPKAQAKKYRMTVESMIKKGGHLEQNLRNRLIQEIQPLSDFKSRYHHAPPGWSIIVSPQVGSDTAFSLGAVKGGGG